MARISKPSYRTAIHLNLGGDLNSSGQSPSNYETEDSCGEEDSKLAQFQRVFKHLEDLESNLSELNKYKEKHNKSKSKSRKDRTQPETQNAVHLKSVVEKLTNSESSFSLILSEKSLIENLNKSACHSSRSKSSRRYSSPLRDSRRNKYCETERQMSPSRCIDSSGSSPFFFARQKRSPSVPEKPYEHRANNTESAKLQNEVHRLRTELDELRNYNTRFYTKTSTLEQKIDDINDSISRKKALYNLNKNLSTEFYEKDKVLTDLCQSKILLEKTRHLTNSPKYRAQPVNYSSYSNSYSSSSYGSVSSSSSSNQTNSPKPQYRPTIKTANSPNGSRSTRIGHSSNYYSCDSYSQNSSNPVTNLNGIDLFKSSVVIEPGRTGLNRTTSCYPIQILHQKPATEVKVGKSPSPILSQSNSRVSFNDHVDEIPIHSRSQSSNGSYKNSLEVKLNSTAYRKEIDDIKTELVKANSENLELKKKLIETQKAIMEERNHSGKWKSLYSKAVQDLSSAENNVQGAPSPVSQENVSQILSDLNSKDNLSKEQIFIHKQTLKSIVQDLHNQNSNLRHKLEKLQTSNAKGLEKLKHFYDENNKLKTELKLIATRKDQNTSDHAKVQYELNSEIKNLNTKLKFEQAQRDELKRRYDCEIGAAKIRYDNELSKQNQIMLSKNQSLEQEINRLNESIKRLLEEKISLMAKMQLNKSDSTDFSTKETSQSIANNSKSLFSTKHYLHPTGTVKLELKKRTAKSKELVQSIKPNGYSIDLAAQNKLSHEFYKHCQMSSPTTFEFNKLSPLILE